MFATEWLTLPSSRLVTLTLLHFVWQGFAVAAMLLVMVEACRVRRVGARYACSLVALVVMVLMPLATLGVLSAQRGGGSDLVISGLDLVTASPPAVVSFWGYWLQRVEPAVLVVWCCGVVLFGGRLLTGVVGVVRLRRNALPLPPKFVAVVEQLGRRLRMDAAGIVLLSHQVTDAMAVGLVRPLVLIPAAWVTEMPLEMLEAVIAHELAHLARRDLWVNLLQRVVETVLFYHPAVWWLSRRLRIERELCADDLAVAATGKRLEYAQALEHIAGERLADIRPALAAFLRGENEMRLLQRVRNVLKQSPEERSRLWPAGLAALALPLGLWAAAAWNSPAVADDEEKKPVIKREREERAEIKRATARPERERSEGNKRVEAEKEKVRGFIDEAIFERKKSAPAEVREERYTIVREGQPAEERVERVIVTRDGKPLTVDVKGERRETSSDHRLDELTTLVKQLSRNVERLQDEVSHLRAQKQGEQSYRTRRDDEDRSSLERSKRELQENIERAALAKHIASEKAEVEARAAKQQAEAARRAATDQKEAAERKLRRVEEEKHSSPEPREPKERTRAEPGRSDGERDLLPRRRESSNSNPLEGNEQSQLDLRRRELKQAQEQLETFRRQVVDREKLLYELAQKQGEGTGQRVQKEIRQKLEAENQEIAKRAAKEKELAAAAKEIEASRQRTEAARKAIEDQIRKLKEEAASDKTSAERQAIEEKIVKLREGVIEIQASGAKTEVKRKLIDDQIHKLKERRVEPTAEPEMELDLNDEVFKKLQRDQQALLTGPEPQPKPVSRPGVGR